MGRFWKIQRGGGGSYEKSLPWGGGMDIFWNHTLWQQNRPWLKYLDKSLIEK